MKHILCTFLMAASLLSACVEPVDNDKIAHNINDKAQQVQLLEDAQRLHTILSESDTIRIDSIQKCIDQGVDLNYPVPFEHTVESNPFRPGTLFSFLNSSTTKTWELNALQVTFLNQKPGYEDAILYLLSQGADPNHQTKDHMVCLDWMNLLELDSYWRDTLMAYGADPSLANMNMVGTDLELIEFYVNRGANPKTINLNHFFESNYGRECKFAGEDVWINNFTSVLKYDVNVQAADPKNFITAYWSSELPIVEMLVSSGLDFNEPIDQTFEKHKSKSDRYWLDFALKIKNTGLLEYLLLSDATKTNIKVDREYLRRAWYDQELKQLIKEKLMK